MRVLLILALLLASVFMGPQAGAQSHAEHAQHQMHAMTGHQHDGGQDQDRDGGKAHAALHVCPGCALVAPPLLRERTVERLALPRRPANPPSLTAFNANPIPPPPRGA
jgi:hypothetical protein